MGTAGGALGSGRATGASAGTAAVRGAPATGLADDTRHPPPHESPSAACAGRPGADHGENRGDVVAGPPRRPPSPPSAPPASGRREQRGRSAVSNDRVSRSVAPGSRSPRQSEGQPLRRRRAGRGTHRGESPVGNLPAKAEGGPLNEAVGAGEGHRAVDDVEGTTMIHAVVDRLLQPGHPAVAGGSGTITVPAPGPADRPTFTAEHRADLVRFAAFRLGRVRLGGQDAEDLVQNVLVRVLSGDGTGRAGAAADRCAGTLDRPDAYLRRALANECVSHWRRHRREIPTDEVPDRLAKRPPGGTAVPPNTCGPDAPEPRPARTGLRRRVLRATRAPRDRPCGRPGSPRAPRRRRSTLPGRRLRTQTTRQPVSPSARSVPAVSASARSGRSGRGRQ